MAEDKERIIDEYGLDQEELKRVEELLKSSSHKRKKITTAGSGEKKSFIDICKENILIPILMLVALAAIGFSIYYFTTQEEEQIVVNSLGITYETLTENYKNSTAYQTLFSQFKTELPALEYTENEDNSNSQLNYFGGSISNEFTTYAIALQGSSRKSDNELVALRFMFELPSDDSNEEEFTTTLFLYYEMIMNSVFPNSTPSEIDAMLASTSKSQQFEINGNVAYRFSIQKVDDISFYALDFAPAADYESFE